MRRDSSALFEKGLNRRRNQLGGSFSQSPLRGTFETLEERCLLAVLNVNSLADNTMSDASLTLREANLLVNHGGDPNQSLGRPLTPEEIAQLDTTENFGNNDTIQFASAGQIVLGKQLTLSQNVSIVGLGADVLTFDAMGTNRVIEITSGKTVSISGVTITGGNVVGVSRGGGILSAGNLTLDSAIVAGNSSQSSGGGLYSASGRLDISQTSFSGNVSQYGGGVYVDVSSSMPVSIDDSSFYGNQANVSGNGAGGGMFVNGAASSGDVVITNSTFSGNYAVQYSGGLRAYDQAEVTVVNSTFVFNVAGVSGGGIGSHNSSLLTIHNSIVSANHAPHQADASGMFASYGAYNLVGTDSPWSLRSGTRTIVSDEPGLGALGYYGGLTPTHTLEPDSPAVDAGLDVLALSWGITGDQRQSSRPVDYVSKPNGTGGASDIGAYELSLPGIADVTVEEDAANSVIDLQAAFGVDLTSVAFEVLTNSNPALFTALSVQEVASTTRLVLNYAPDKSGTADITVAMHHPTGITDTLGFQVVVNPVNDVPVISAVAEELVFDTETLQFSFERGNAITISDKELAGSLVEILSPRIPDVSYMAQMASREFHTQGTDDYSEHGFGNRAVSLNSAFFAAPIGTTLNDFITASDQEISEALAVFPESFSGFSNGEQTHDELDWQHWLNQENSYAIVDIEGPAHPKEWRTILHEQGLERLHQVFHAYKRRIDLAHEMYPQLRLLVWGAPSPSISAASVDDVYVAEQIDTVAMAVSYGVFDNAYGLAPRVFQHWGEDDASLLATQHIEDNVLSGVIGAQEAIKRGVELTHGMRGTHLNVVPVNSWTVLNANINNELYGTVNQREEYAAGYLRQLVALQKVSGGTLANVNLGLNSEQIEVARVPAVLSAHLHRRELQPVDLDRYAQELEVAMGDQLLGKLEVTLTADHGRLTLGDLADVVFTNGDGLGDASMTFWGSLDEVNRALDGLQFEPQAGYVGIHAGIEIKVDDQGSAGTQILEIDVTVGKQFNVNVRNDVLDVGLVGDGYIDVFPGLAGDQVSLRAAVLEANAMDVPARIVLPEGRFNLTRTGAGNSSDGDLDISGNVEIVGAGANLSIIHAGGASGIGDRVIEISSGSTVAISGVTITGGNLTGVNRGGGIRNAGNLTLEEVTVTNNATQSSGGGLYSSTGSVNIARSSFEYNSAKYGGGISLDTTGGTLVRIDGSTFHRNEADIFGVGSGGGMFVNGGPTPGNVIITNSTFSANSAAQYSGGLRANNSAAVFIVNSTFTLNDAGVNGGGIGSFDSSLVTIFNSIVSANSAPSQADANGLFADVSDYNLVGTATPLELRNAGSHNIVSDNPRLQALGFYGGPTRTHPLHADSLAVDAGIDALALTWGINSDQRNAVRPVDYFVAPNGSGGTTDIGAFELQNAASLLEEVAAFVVEQYDAFSELDAAFEQLTESA